MHPAQQLAWTAAIAIAASLASPGNLDAREPRIPWTTSKVVGSPEAAAPARLERVRPDLSFDNPLDLLFDTARGRWWVAQQGGRILTFGPGPDSKPELAIDLKAGGRPCTQLFGVALDPGHATNRFVYLAYNTEEDKPDGSRVSRFRVSESSPPTLDPASELVLIRWVSGGHNGGCLKFGPDGMLYISTGDHASPEPPDVHNTGQSLDDLLSAVLRIDVRNATPERPYRVPSDNPFVQRPGARPEIWAYGFRNPWRMAFAPDGALWLGDVGWELWETVHRVTAGYNGGWSRMEGPFLARPEVEAPTPVQRPAAAHGHHEAASITGGDFYRGRAFPAFTGSYVYGDWETGKIWALSTKAGSNPVEIADSTVRIVSFANGPDSEMYLLDYQPAGGLYRLVPNPPSDPGAFPRRLSATGLFSDTARRAPAPGVVGYTPAAPRWHDGAEAERLVGIPGPAKAEPGGPWKFPAGTVFAKTLVAGRPVETQMLHFTGEEWRAYSYRWNSEGTDAELLPAAGGTHETGPAGARRPWTFLSRSDCLRCHNSWSGFVLGFNTPQLAHGPAPALARFLQDGLVTSNAFCIPTYPLASPSDTSAPAELRARSWLHANCAPCHRFGAGASVTARFGADEKPADLRIVDARPARGDFGLPDARIVAPGHPERSVAWHRINTGGAGHMPPIGSRNPDPAGARLIADWIRSLGQGTRPAAGPTPVWTAADALTWLDATLPSAPPEPIIRAALTGTNATARDLLAPYAPADLRRNTLGPSVTVAQVLKLKGNATRGAALFASPDGPGCATCHRTGSAPGPELGPNLAGIATRLSPEDLAESLVNPSARISPEYQWHECERTDGETVAGFLAGRTPDVVRLRGQDGVETRIPAREVKALKPIPASLMPEGLLGNLTEAEAGDLMAFLRSLR